MTTNQTKSVSLTSSAISGIARGRAAWNTLKATAEEQRTLWLEVGVALMYGKLKENRKVGQKFSEWADEAVPGLTGKATADAIWFAENSVVTSELPAGITHPQNIRAWFNEQQAARALDAVLPIDLQNIAPVAAIRRLRKPMPRHFRC